MNRSTEPAPRSLHVITSTARRGAETFAVELASSLEQLGSEAQVLALVASGDPRAHAVPSLGASRRSPAALAKLRREASRTDVVVAHGSATLEACAFALAGTGVPLVYRVIGELGYWVRSDAHRLILRGLLRTPRRHVVLWRAAAGQLATEFGIARDRIDVIANAVNETPFTVVDHVSRQRARVRLGMDRYGSQLAYVGALTPEKDISTAIDAVAMLGQAHLLIAGDGPLRAELEHQARELAPGRVRFVGVTKTPAEVYAAADLLLLPSWSEGMPGVIIEAGLVGTPSVATAVGAVPEMIEHGTTGFVTSPRDPRSMAACIREALPVASQVGARAAAAFRESYTMEQVAPRWARTLQVTCET